MEEIDRTLTDTLFREIQNVMKGGMHKAQNPKRYEVGHAQSSIIHNTVQNIILPQIGLAQEMDTKTL